MLMRRLQRFLSIAAFTAATAAAQTTTTGTVTQTSNTPAVGLASSETAQINLVNTASNSSSGTAASCTGTVTFLNASGTAIGAAQPFTATSGAIVSVSLPFGKTGATGVRTEIRATISRTLTVGVAIPPGASVAAPCALEATLETYDSSTGVTHVFVPNLGVPNGPTIGRVFIPGGMQ